MESNNTIDFGEVKLPTTWSDITLKQYQELQKARDNDADIIKIISILTNREENEIRSMPASFVSTMANKIIFLSTPPEVKPSNKYKQYCCAPLEEMTFGEWLDCNTALQNDKTDYATIFAILCRLPNEQYDQDFINKKFQERKEMFENTSVNDMLPLALFFSTYLIVSTMISKASSNQQSMLVKSIAQNKRRSQRNGVFKRASMYLRKKMSRKSQRS